MSHYDNILAHIIHSQTSQLELYRVQSTLKKTIQTQLYTSKEGIKKQGKPLFTLKLIYVPPIFQF